MRFEEMNWMDVEQYLQHDDRVMIILGACEQHGYLSLLSDSKIPQALADAASQKTNIIVAPPLNFGVSPYFTSYPGTISVRVTTYVEIVADVIRSLYGYGFRRIAILNGHGGNSPAQSRLIELMNELPGLKTVWYAWWTAPSVIAVAARHNLQPYHASWSEAFSFTRVAELPDGEKIPVISRRLYSAKEEREAYGDGVFGGRYWASDQIMDEVFHAALNDIIEILKFPD